MAKLVRDLIDGSGNPLRLAAYSAAIHLPRPIRPVEDAGGGWRSLSYILVVGSGNPIRPYLVGGLDAGFAFGQAVEDL